MAEKIEPPPYIDDLTVREVWAETSQTLNGPPGTIKLEFCTYHWSVYPPIVIDRVTPVSRIALTIQLARSLRDQLTAAIDGLEKQAQLAAAPAASQTKN